MTFTKAEFEVNQFINHLDFLPKRPIYLEDAFKVTAVSINVFLLIRFYSYLIKPATETEPYFDNRYNY